MTHPYLDIMRRYCVDYTTGHDMAVVPQILDRSYRFTMSGTTLDYDAYVAMVDGAFDHFPDLGLVVHDLFWNGDRLAMRFSEYASAPRFDGNRAVWMGISMYRWNGIDRLTECLVEQDFYGRLQQLKSGTADDQLPALDHPWHVEPRPGSPELDEHAKRWAIDFDDGLLDTDRTEIVDVFSAGESAAVRFRRHGTYAGGLDGVEAGGDAFVDTNATVHADGTSWSVTDRFGLRNRLRTRA